MTVAIRGSKENPRAMNLKTGGGCLTVKVHEIVPTQLLIQGLHPALVFARFHLRA
jgi:hypothetical protein